MGNTTSDISSYFNDNFNNDFHSGGKHESINIIYYEIKIWHRNVYHKPFPYSKKGLVKYLTENGYTVNKLKIKFLGGHEYQKFLIGYSFNKDYKFSSEDIKDLRFRLNINPNLG